MVWNIGDNRSIFLKLKSHLGLYHVVLTTTKTPLEKFTLTIGEMQHMPGPDKTESKEELSCLKWTLHSVDEKYVKISRLIQTS